MPEERKRKKKRKTRAKKPTPQLTLTPSLPDDLLLICLARVSRLYYPTLSLVSKRIRSLLASPELYQARRLSGHTESCLYVCFSFYSKLLLFTLCRRKPDQDSETGYYLARVPTIPLCPPRRAEFSNLVAIGSDIYKIGGEFHDPPSSSVSILDCKSHRWREGPRLPVELGPVTASVIDGKIYVAGCGECKEKNSNSFHVLDTRTHIWDPEPIPCRLAKGSFNYPIMSARVDGKFHVSNLIEEVVYNPKEGRWDVEQRTVGLRPNSYCEIGNVLYCFGNGRFMWYDTEVRAWRDLQGLEVGLRKIPDHCEKLVRLADYGGKMAVVWKERTDEDFIWCAEIALERRNTCEIWGKVEWCANVLMPVPPICFRLVKVLSVTL